MEVDPDFRAPAADGCIVALADRIPLVAHPHRKVSGTCCQTSGQRSAKTVPDLHRRFEAAEHSLEEDNSAAEASSILVVPDTEVGHSVVAGNRIQALAEPLQSGLLRTSSPIQPDPTG